MDRTVSRRLRWAAPVAVAVAVAGGVQLSARASATAALPQISARDLLVKAQQAKVTQITGTVRSTTALGLPALPRQPGADWSTLAAGTQTLRVFADGPARQRVDLLGDLAQASIVRDGRTLWTWSSTTRKVTRTPLPDPATAARRSRTGLSLTDLPVTPQQAADRALSALTPSTVVTVGRSASVAGRDAYDLRLVPKDAASLVGRVDLYVDARTGLALRTVVVPRGSAQPALDIGFTSLRLAAPARSTFRFVPPPGSSVSNLALPTPSAGDRLRGGPPGAGTPDVRSLGSGWTTVIQAASPAAGGVLRPGDAAADGQSLLQPLLRAARPVQGDFGSGRLLRTRLLTVLLVDDGRVFAGAVSPTELLRVAGSASSAR